MKQVKRNKTTLDAIKGLKGDCKNAGVIEYNSHLWFCDEYEPAYQWADVDGDQDWGCYIEVKEWQLVCDKKEFDRMVWQMSRGGY